MRMIVLLVQCTNWRMADGLAGDNVQIPKQTPARFGNELVKCQLCAREDELPP
jgi:hypothetical protein